MSPKPYSETTSLSLYPNNLKIKLNCNFLRCERVNFIQWLIICVKLIFCFHSKISVLMPGYSIYPGTIKKFTDFRKHCQRQGGEVIHNFNSSHSFAAGFSMINGYTEESELFWYGAVDSTPSGDKVFRDIVDGTLFLNIDYQAGELNGPNEIHLFYKSNGLFGDAPNDMTGASSINMNGICQG